MKFFKFNLLNWILFLIFLISSSYSFTMLASDSDLSQVNEEINLKQNSKEFEKDEFGSKEEKEPFHSTSHEFTETSDDKIPDLTSSPAVITLNGKTQELLIDQNDKIKDNDDDDDDDEQENQPSDNRSVQKNETETDNINSNSYRSNNNVQKDDMQDFVVVPEIHQLKETIPSHVVPPDDRKQKINDSGGISLDETISSNITENIPSSNDVNLTTEEKPIPVFSEWAQKQIQEEAEKQQLEKEVSNSSSKNITNGNKPLKLRVKNYASPDCGAKIIASNSEAQNTGALLSSSKDEYMLSPCTNRIWFVVELCEAIQAKQIDLANFELFSSSPKNFTVAVSNRYPTRDWSNVGRFIAEDQRNIQNFDLHPHLFGKFVRVDVHSHYNSEHFCPISLFRVYGTSEFEAFETENRNPDDFMDDLDDEQEIIPRDQNNFIKSASDAVLSIVKKAAQVLVKTENQDLKSGNLENEDDLCFTPIRSFECKECNRTIVKNVNYLLSCRYLKLQQFLSSNILRDALRKSTICMNFGIDINHESFKVDEHCGSLQSQSDILQFNAKLRFTMITSMQGYYLSLTPFDHIAAMCHLLGQSGMDLKKSDEYSEEQTSVNLTIETDDTFVVTDEKHRIINEIPNLESTISDNQDENSSKEHILLKPAGNNLEIPSDSVEQIPQLEDVNIFNVPSSEEEKDIEQDQTATEELNKKVEELSIESRGEDLPTSTISPSPTIQTVVKTTKDLSVENEPWESIDKLLSEQGSNENSNNPLNTGGINQQNNQRGGHTESVFIRLSNRIKALERNMSLSGQYLEELSRRYKKQVEELQHSFAKTLSALEEQNRRAIDLEQFLIDQNTILRSNIDDLSFKLYLWIIILGIVICVVFSHVLISWCTLSTPRPARQEILLKKAFNKKQQQKLTRRKSVEGVVPSTATSSVQTKLRRPSEEAMKIGGSYADLMIDDAENLEGSGDDSRYNRQRKLSVIYNKDNQMMIMDKLNHQDIPQFTKHLISEGGGDSTNPKEIIYPDDEYENYLPGSDLAYNEFVPDELNTDEQSNFSLLKKKSKLRRLSSPSFFKFSKNVKIKSNVPPTTATGWEWYRLKKNPPKLLEEDEFNLKVNGDLNGSCSSNNSSSNRNGVNYSPNSSFNSHHQIAGSETDSMRTTNSETESSIMILSDTKKNSIKNEGTNIDNKRNSKKQRSFKKILKKVF